MSTNKPLSKWQKFKMWASRSFGCTSTYTIKDNLPTKAANGEAREPVRERAQPANKAQQAADLTDHGKRPAQKPASPENPTNQSNVLGRTFSKDADDIPFIDESMINIPQAVK